MEYRYIYEDLKQKYEQKTNQTVRDDGDLGMRMQVIAGEFATLWEQFYFYEKQLLPQTATGEYLKRHALCRGITPKPAASAMGTLTFSRSTDATQNIVVPLGTVCTTSAGNGILYQTTEAGTLAIGETEVEISAQAIDAGSHTNIQANAIDVLVGGVVGIEAVTNEAPFTGGSEEETEESLRQRLLDSFIKLSTGANKQFYQDLALSVEGVHSAQAVVDGSEVTVYITDIFRTTSDLLVQQVQSLIDSCKALGVTVTVEKAQTVSLSISATVYVDSLQSYSHNTAKVSLFLQEKIMQMRIGQPFNPYSVTADLSEKVPGMGDIVFTTPTALMTPSEGYIVVPGAVSISIAQK